jgi:nucleotide-binding universal stress UspA family protein
MPIGLEGAFLVEAPIVGRPASRPSGMEAGMQFGDILVCIDGSDAGRRRTGLALALAARSRARVIGYYLAPSREKIADWLLDPRQARTVENDIDKAEVDFARLLTVNSLDGTWIPGSESRRVEDIVQYARCVDLVVAGLGAPDDPASDPQRLDIEQLVVECGRPVLGIPDAGIPEQIGQNVMVAWDGGRESTRALHDAIPFLRDAATVKIVSIGGNSNSAMSPGAVIDHLKRLGISATIETTPQLGLTIEDEIFSRIDWEGVDLLVAGAFGHSRIQEHIFGGVSRSLLHQMMVPVLVSH